MAEPEARDDLFERVLASIDRLAQQGTILGPDAEPLGETDTQATDDDAHLEKDADVEVREDLDGDLFAERPPDSPEEALLVEDLFIPCPELGGTDVFKHRLNKTARVNQYMRCNRIRCPWCGSRKILDLRGGMSLAPSLNGVASRFLEATANRPPSGSSLEMRTRRFKRWCALRAEAVSSVPC